MDQSASERYQAIDRQRGQVTPMQERTTLQTLGLEGGRARSLRQLAWDRFRRHRLALIGLVVLLIEITIAVSAPVLISQDLALHPQPTKILENPSATHLLGTDEAGRDILARLIYAGRVSLTIGILAMTVSVTVGTGLGAIAGYYGGWIDNIIMRFTDAMLSIPLLFFLIVLAVVLGPSVPTLIIAIGLLSWMELARIVRGSFLSLKSRDFIEGARAIGVRDVGIIVNHILPNTLAPITVASTLGVGNAILTEAAVSYLGLGVQPPSPSWGNMLYNAQNYLWNAPWVALYPGVMILITVLCINFVGDALRDALDPRMTI
jgi:peptide/nickel transport system permease protein